MFGTPNAPEFVLDVMRRGYRLPVGEYPTLCFSPNAKSPFRVSEFVALAIAEILAN